MAARPGGASRALGATLIRHRGGAAGAAAALYTSVTNMEDISMSLRTASAATVAAVDRRQRLCDVFGEEYDPDSWADWRWQLRHRLSRPEHFERYLELTSSELNGLRMGMERF